MAVQMLSPGVYIQETEASAIVPNTSVNVAFLAGNFEKGPVDVPYIVTNRNEYVDIFGTPNDSNYNEWFQGYKFFDYANQLVVTRAYEELLTDNAPGYTIDSPIGEIIAVDDFDPEKPIITVEDYDLKYHVNDLVCFGGEVSVWRINSITPTETDTQLEIESFDGSSIHAPLPGSLMLLQTNVHSNGGTYIQPRGAFNYDLGGTIPAPTVAVAADPNINVDINTGIHNDIMNTNRSNFKYEIVKNYEDFDNQYESGGIKSFFHGAKLKFINRSPNTDKIEIAIANWYDFRSIDENNNNHAVAFIDGVGLGASNIYLKSLFEYAPLEDQVAIALKQGDTIETYIVSMNPIAVDGNGRNNYVESVINEDSNLVFVIDNTGLNYLNEDYLPATYLVCDRFGLTNRGDLNPNGMQTYPAISQGGRNPIVTVGALRTAYFTVEDKERYEVDVLIGNEKHPNIAIDLALHRKDCIAYIGARYTDTVGKKAIQATNKVINYLTDGVDGAKITRTMFAAFFGNYFRIYDKFNRKYRWINIAGDMAGIRCDVTSQNSPWWVSAGLSRGIVRNINKMAFTPSQEQRDNLYKTGINPIVAFPGSGNVVWGNKTLHPIASSFDRINVRTLFNTIERSMSKAAKSQVFEFNDPYTRNAILSMFNPYLATIKAGRGITDYLVQCDEQNNTPDVISRNELRVDIYIKPNYAAEFILLSFTNVGTRSFSEVVGL